MAAGSRRVTRRREGRKRAFLNRRSRSEKALRLSTRLVAISAMLVAATLLTVTAIVVLVTRSYLVRELNHELATSAHSFKSGPLRRLQEPADLSAQTRRWLEISAFSGEQVVAVRTKSGKVLSNESPLDIRSLPNGRDLLLATRARWWDVTGPDGMVRALTVPIVLGGHQIGTLVCAAPRTVIDATLGAVLTGIVWASAAGLLMAGGLGLAATRRTLRPLRRMSEDIRAIEEGGDLTRRVAEDGPRDEVGRVAAAFNRMLGKLEDTFSSQRRFLSDASHELRTPLTIARGQLELLQSEVKKPEHNRSLDLAVEELDRMRRIVEDLLLLARVDEGLHIERTPVEAELIIREALLRAMLVDRREATVEADPDLFVQGDQEMLLRVLTNLVRNAVQHTNEEASIRVRARGEGNQVLMEVSDNGPGILPEDLPHVFDRMYRGARARTSSPGGAGLGLAIAWSLVQAMDGEITVASSEAGTTFALRLPATTWSGSIPLAESPQRGSQLA